MHKNFSPFPVYPIVSEKGHPSGHEEKRTPNFPVYFRIRKVLASLERVIIRARGLTRLPNYPTYPVYRPYPERVIPPGHETPKISAYFNIRTNSGLFTGRVIPSGHEGKPEIQKF